MGFVTGTLWAKRWIIVVATLLVVIIIGVDITQNFSLIHKFTSSWTGRLLPWLTAWYMFMDAPLLGNGIHTFGALYETYKQTIDIPASIPIDVHTMAWAHNLYLETLAEQGVVGITSLGVVLSHGLLLSWQIRTSKLQDIRIMNVGALASLLSFCLAAIFEISLIRYWCVTILFLLLAIITVCYCFSFNGGVND
jgi:O-antigen ligase